MACALHTAALPAGTDPAPRALPFTHPVLLPMSRCECAGLSFQEIAHEMAAQGASLDEVGRRTGCGTTCTACLPDLRRFLSAR